MPLDFEELREWIIIPSNARQILNSPEVARTTSKSYVPLKKVIMAAPGGYRIKYTARRTGFLQQWSTEIRRNGDRVGLPITSSSGRWTTYIADIGLWLENDLLEVSGQTYGENENATLEVTNLELWGEWSFRLPAPAAGEILTA